MLFKDMPAEELRAAYYEARAAVNRYSAMANTGGFGNRGRRQIAGGANRAWDRLDLIVKIADKRGINLAG